CGLCACALCDFDSRSVGGGWRLGSLARGRAARAQQKDQEPNCRRCAATAHTPVLESRESHCFHVTKLASTRLKGEVLAPLAGPEQQSTHALPMSEQSE